MKPRGGVPADPIIQCPSCGGDGLRPRISGGYGDCFYCRGQGWVVADEAPVCVGLIECSVCGGDGGWDVATHINRTHGGWDGYHEKCWGCGGTGSIEAEGEPIDLDDLLDGDRERLDEIVRMGE